MSKNKDKKKSIFGKAKKPFENIKPGGQAILPPNAKVKTISETPFRPKDVAILRECLAGLHKKVPPILQKKITNALLQFATSVKEYCQCDEKVFIENEQRYACLNCGTRHKNKDGDPRLVE